MIEDVSKKLNIKTYVKGTFLLSEDGFQYKERINQGKLEEKIVQDRIGFLSLQQQIQKQKAARQEKQKLPTKKSKVPQRPTLIPIKDTPVEPIPEPVQQYQKCEMATQQQFEFYQNSIAQRDKERELERQKQLEIQNFLERKEKKALEPPAQTVNLVFIKQETVKQVKPKRVIKKIIKKKEENQQKYEKPSKVKLIQGDEEKQEQIDETKQKQKSEQEQKKEEKQQGKQNPNEI